MGLKVKKGATADPETLPPSGGEVRATFEAAGSPKATRLRAVYRIGDEPYIFESSSDDPKTVEGDVEPVRTSPTEFPFDLELTKSPPSAPRAEFVAIRIEITEVDADGEPVTGVGGQPLPPTRRTAVVTIE